MDSCNHPNKCNCLKDCTCPSGFTCCSESENPAKATPTYGHCVKESTCDKRKGICYEKGSKFRKPIHNTEIISIYTSEGYNNEEDKECSNWRGAFGIMMVLIVMLLFCIIAMVKTKNN